MQSALTAAVCQPQQRKLEAPGKAQLTLVPARCRAARTRFAPSAAFGAAAASFGSSSASVQAMSQLASAVGFALAATWLGLVLKAEQVSSWAGEGGAARLQGAQAAAELETDRERSCCSRVSALLIRGLTRLCGSARRQSCPTLALCALLQDAMEAQGRRECETCGGTGRIRCICTKWSDRDVGCGACDGTGLMECTSCGGGGNAVPIEAKVYIKSQHSQRRDYY